jgi:N-acetyl-gamma-glutamyl-phosphate reductase
MTKKRIGILGASGFGGLELIKILARHTGVDLVVLNSDSTKGHVRDLLPDCDDQLRFTHFSLEEVIGKECDVIFCAREAGYAKKITPMLSCRIIDLSQDFRFCDGSVYGLPELYREAIPGARIVANPGCYATVAILAACPIIRQASVKHVVFDCKSGYSGAGRTPSVLNDPHHYENNVIAYRIARHRHVREIAACFSDVAYPVPVSFTPHVIPLFRGIMCTAHILLNQEVSAEQVFQIYQESFCDEPFVKVLSDRVPELHDVQGSNMCCLGGFEIDDTGRLVIVATIDNLIKGASGQAVQNMNLMLGFPETFSLTR